MNYQYQQLAYERTVVTAVRRHLEDKYLGVGGSSREELVCEEVPYATRNVPTEIFVEFIQRLSEEERRLTVEMASYDFRKIDVKPLPTVSKDQAEQEEPEDAQRPRGKGGKLGVKSSSSSRMPEPERGSIPRRPVRSRGASMDDDAPKR